MKEKKVRVEIETPHGTVRWKQITLPPPPKVAQIVRELTSEELTQMQKDAEAATEFIRKYVAGEQDEDVLENLDLAFASWLHSKEVPKEKDERVIRMVGAAYGRYCIDRLGLRWAVVKDERGTDMALVRENPTARSFPFSAVQYRIEDKKADFICALYESLAYSIADVQK